MRGTWFALSFAAVIAGLTARSTQAQPAGGDNPPANKLIAHEWGTFTSYSSADGLLVDYRTTVGSDLPEFVYDRARWTGDGRHLQIVPDKLEVRAEQRMETPVIYFYTDRPQTVDVRVNFPSGLLTEFYPAPFMMRPPFVAGKAEPITLSSIGWRKLAVLPVDHLRQSGERGPLGHAPSLPRVDPTNHYIHARDTDSAWVRQRLGERDEYEKFLFYRGVGNFKLPISVESKADGSLVITSEAEEPLPAVFVLSDNCCGAADIHFAQYSDVRGRVVLDKPLENTSLDQVAQAMTRALVKAGLYELEARAMVKTWHASWLTESGLRVLYILPRYLADAILPLQIDPEPQELVRVFMGRIEVLGSEQQKILEGLLARLGAAPGEPERIEQILQQLGRFAEPALRIVASQTADEAVRRAAERLIARLNQPLRGGGS